MAKYTDEQIKKALELCVNWEAEYCKKCPFDDECGNDGDTPLRNAIDLINRQEAEKEALIAGQETLQKYLAEKEAEIERSQGLLSEWKTEAYKLSDNIDNIKSEAIKEFAESIKSYIDAYVVFEYAAGEQNLLDYIDNLVKEMVGESK